MNRITTRPGLSIVIVLAGIFMSALDLMIVNIAFPSLQRSFPSSNLNDITWVLSAYGITLAALLIPAGRWADRFGRRRAFLYGIALFTVASAGCAAAPSVGVLVASRVVQAAGGALMLPSSLGLLIPLFPPEKRGTALGLWSAMAGVAGVAGPPIGGLLVQADWRWVFLVNLPVGVVAVLIGWRVLPEIREKWGAAPDVLGALLLAATVTAIVAAILEGQAWGWGGARIVGLIVLGAVGAVLSGWRAFRHPAPVIEPAILRIRAVALGDVAALLFFSGFGVLILATTLFLTGVWRHSVLDAGLELGPGPIVGGLFAVPGGRLAARLGPRRVGVVGSVLFAASGVWLAAKTGSSPDYNSTFLPGLVLSGACLGLVAPSLAGAATLPLPPERIATGIATMTMCRQVGLAVGAAVVAAVLGVRPDLSAFHTAWLCMAAFGFASGLTLLGIGALKTQTQARSQVSDALDRELTPSSRDKE